MKTVLICAAPAPFITGGAEILVSSLEREFSRRGFQVATAALPFKWYPVSGIVRQALAWRMLDVTESNGTPIDLVVATKFPTYVVDHPRKVTWLFHQHREAYDLFGTEHCGYKDTAEDREAREALIALDTKSLSESRKIFTISENVAARLKRFNDLDGTALYPPPHHLGRYRCDSSGDFLFTAGRLDRLKRIDLLIEALHHAPAARLKIAGRGPLEGELRAQAARLGVSDRVEFLGFVADNELVDLYARCMGAVYVPRDEDYGYVTVEAFLSKKPVVTVSDAGGVLEFVSHEENGFVASPDPKSLGDALQRFSLLGEAQRTEMGARGHARVSHLSWDLVIDALVGAAC